MNISPISSHISPWMMPATDSTQCYIPQAMMKKGHQTMVSCVAQTLSTSVELSCPIYIYIYITNATKMASEEVFHSNLCRQENGIAYRGMVLTITKSQRVLTDWWPVTIHWFHLPARNWRSSSRLFFFSSADCPSIYLCVSIVGSVPIYVPISHHLDGVTDRQDSEKKIIMLCANCGG